MRILYDFEFETGRTEHFDLRFDRDTLSFQPRLTNNLPDWTLLDCNICPHCTLDRISHERCPLAVCIHEAVDRFRLLVSHEPVSVQVTSDERKCFQKTTAQKALSSMLGLLMPCSGCPHTLFFRPMARFHLPFSSKEETLHRALSNLLLARYFRGDGAVPAGDPLLELKAIYKNIECMNVWVARRIREHVKADSSVNALVLLDLFAKMVSFSEDAPLEAIRNLFTIYKEG